MPNRMLSPVGPARLGSCILINLLATPGLGSLIARRWVAGTGQLILAVAGCVMMMVWFFAEMIQYYGQISGSVQLHPVGWIGIAGAILFAVAWFWSLITSISLFLEARRNAEAEALKNYSSNRPVPPKL